VADRPFFELFPFRVVRVSVGIPLFARLALQGSRMLGCGCADLRGISRDEMNADIVYQHARFPAREGSANQAEPVLR
jgi:hypothetical protein